MAEHFRPLGRAGTVLRAAAASVIVVVAAPLLVVVLLLVFGTIVGVNLADSSAGAIGWAAVVGLIIAVVSVVSTLYGVLAVATVVVRPRLFAALWAALRVFPRMLLALLLALLAVIAALFGWSLFVVAGLVVALVLRIRRRSGTRRALIGAIPFLPLAFALALVPATVAAALEQPRSIRSLFRSAVAVIRVRWRALLGFVLGAGTLSAGLGWATSAASAALESDGRADAALAVTAVAFVLQLGLVGAALATAIPPVSPSTPVVSSPVRPVAKAADLRVAMLVVASLVFAIVPGAVNPASASAVEALTPVLTTTVEADGASWLVVATVEVPAGDPSGTVQFFDGERKQGEPAPLVVSADKATVARATLSDSALDPGPHSITFGYTPASGLVSAAVSDPFDHEVAASSGSPAISEPAISEPVASPAASSGPVVPGPVPSAVLPDPVPSAAVPSPEPNPVPVPASSDPAATDAPTTLAGSRLAATVAGAPAATTATASLSTSTAEYAESVTLTVAVASSLDGARTLEVRDTTKNVLLSTTTIQIVAGTASPTIDIAGLVPGKHDIAATVLGDSLSAEAVAPSSTLTVTQAKTVTTVQSNLSSVEFGTPITFYATTLTTSGATTKSVGRVTFVIAGKTIGTAVPGSSGRASIVWTPTVNDIGQYDSATITMRASYFDTGFLYEGSLGTSTVLVARVPLPAPSMVWTVDPAIYTYPHLTITYPAAEGHPVPTGAVELTDPQGNRIGELPLVNGVVDFPVIINGTIPPLQAEYLGWAQDPPRTYAGRFDAVPDALPQAYTPDIVVTAPTDAVAGTAVTVAVDISNIPLSLVQQVVLTDVKPDGSVNSVGVVTPDVIGHGEASVTLDAEGVHKIGATVIFDSSIGMAPAYAPTVTVTVAAPAPSVPHLVVSASGDLVAGGAIDVDVTAEWIAPGSTGLAAGTVAEVRDGSGTRVGSVTLWGAPGVNGYSGRLRMSVPHGGDITLTASATYGPLATPVSSDPLTLTLAAPPTTLSLSIPNVVVGQTLKVGVTAYAAGGFSGLSRAQAATVVIDGKTWPVTLTRATATDVFRGTVIVPTSHAGPIAIIAALDGDGIDTSAATLSTTISVLKRPTSIDLKVVSGTRAGEPVTVTATIVQQGPQTSPAPTGALYVGGLPCTIGTPCVIPGSVVHGGVNTVYAQFDGDADNLVSTGSVSFTADARTSALAVTYSPAIQDWVYGEPITATWTTTTSARTAVGVVGVTIAGASCSGPAASGSCTLTPTTTETSAPITTAYLATFVPSDDAPPAKTGGSTTAASLCLFPAIDGTVDYTAATRCGFESRGVRSGSLLSVTPTLADGNKLDHWVLNGKPVGATVPYRFALNGPTQLSYTTVYKPACYTLTFVQTQTERVINGGVLTPLTAPNCTDPYTSTPAELAQMRTGSPRYAAGTVVHIRADASGENPSFSLSGSIVGTTMVSDTVGTVTMDADHTVSAVFAVSDCTATDFLAVLGGTVTLTSATRPASSDFLEPATGACTTSTGRAGYVPGTTLGLTATPDDGSVIESWLVNSGMPLTEEQRAIVSVATLPAAPVGTTRTVVVPSVRLELGARFSRVQCVSVTLVSRTPIGVDDLTKNRVPAGASIVGYQTSTGCGGIAQTRTVSPSGSGSYGIVSITDSYVASGWVDTTTAAPFIPGRFTGRAPFYQVNSSSVNWSTAAASDLRNRAYPNSSTGPSVGLHPTDSGIVINADWSTTCAAPDVTLPQGGSYLFSAAYPDEPFCQDSSLVAPGEMVTIQPTPIPGAPALTPITTQIDTGDYQKNSATVMGGVAYRLEYCVPLGLTVRLRDDAGAFTGVSDEQAATLIEDDGGCPPLWTRQNHTTKTFLATTGAFGYSVVGSAEGLGPVRTVDARGTVSGSSQFDLQTVCYTLSGKDAHQSTPGNCPGGAANRFLVGTTVQLMADEADRFDGWGDVDAQQDQSAWVVMDRDRYVEANIHNYSNLEKAGNFLSSLTQRAASAIMTAATGALLAQAYLLQTAGRVLKVASAGLKFVGAGGAFTDALDKGSKVIDAQFTALSLLATCMSTGAHPDDILVIPDTGPATVKKGASNAETLAAIKSALQQKALGNTGAIPVGSALGDVGKAVNTFFSNPELYAEDSQESWNRFGSGIGECMTTGLKNYVNTTYK